MTPFELKAGADGDVSGYGSVFTVVDSAFDRTLPGATCREHAVGRLVARLALQSAVGHG